MDNGAWTGGVGLAPAQAWAATRTDRAPLVPLDLEALRDQTVFNPRLPVVVDVDRPYQVDLVLLVAPNHVGGTHIARIDEVLRGQKVLLCQRLLDRQQLRDIGGRGNRGGDLDEQVRQ